MIEEITAYDTDGRSLDELAQWDSEITVCISEKNITEAFPLHFFNSSSDVAYVVETIFENSTLKAKIPNILLTQPYAIIGYVHTTINGENKSNYRFRINVRQKPQPSDYILADTADYILITDVLDECRDYSQSAQAAEANARASETNSANSAVIAGNNILNGVSTHNADATAHPAILESIRQTEAIARGRATSYTFDTYAQLQSWLAGTYTRADGVTASALVSGDNLRIVDTSVPDYWWDEDSHSVKPLKAENPDLTEYYTKAQVDALLPIMISRSAYDALVAAGTVQADRTYDIYEDE